MERAWKRRSLPWIVRWFGRRPGPDFGDEHAKPGASPHSSHQTSAPRTDVRTTAQGVWARAQNGAEAEGRNLRVLVVRQDNRLGNMVLLVPFLRSLRDALPTAHIAMVTGDEYADLVQKWPWADEWIVQPKRLHATQPWRFPGWLRRLRRGGWDIAFEMSNHNTHSYYNCVLTVASGAPCRIGFDEPRNADALTHAVPPPGDRVPFALAPLRLLSETGLPVTPAAPSIDLTTPPSPRFQEWRRGELGEDGYALVHVGGRGEKAWPLESWTRLVPKMRALGGPRIVLIGGPDEIDRMRALEAEPVGVGRGDTDAQGRPELVAPPFDVGDLSHLLRGASYYLGCDTGVMHLAASLGTPTVALFFRSNPVHYAPLGRVHKTVLLADPYDAASRWEDAVPEMGSVERSRLFVGPLHADRSPLGVPSTEDDADPAILAAIEDVLA